MADDWHKNVGFFYKFDDFAEMAADIGVVGVVPEVVVDFVLVAEDDNLGLALQLLHILGQQRPLLKITNNKRTDKLLHLNILTQISISKTFNRIILQLLLNFLKFSTVVMFINNINRICDTFAG